MCKAILISAYFEKQRKFIALIKDIQVSLNSKEYKKHGYTFNEYIKMKWNISQAQAYRYLRCGKVLDQLEEFEIKPSYERLCKALSNVAKTPIQMKILWSAILKKTGGRPDCINSTHVNNIWKEICSNEKYSDVCKYEGDIMNRIEKSLNKFEKEKKHKQLNSDKIINNNNNNNNNNNKNIIFKSSNNNNKNNKNNNININNTNSSNKENKINNVDSINSNINNNSINKNNLENNNENNISSINIKPLQYPKNYNTSSNSSLPNHLLHNISVDSKTILKESSSSNKFIYSSSSVSPIPLQNISSSSSSLSNSSIQNISLISNKSTCNSTSSLSNNLNGSISPMSTIISNNTISNTPVVFNSISSISSPIPKPSSFSSYSMSNNSIPTIPAVPNSLPNPQFSSIPMYNTSVMPHILNNSYITSNNHISNIPVISNNSISNIPVMSNTNPTISVIQHNSAYNTIENKTSLNNIPIIKKYIVNESILPNSTTTTSSKINTPGKN